MASSKACEGKTDIFSFVLNDSETYWCYNNYDWWISDLRMFFYLLLLRVCFIKKVLRSILSTEFLICCNTARDLNRHQPFWQEDRPCQESWGSRSRKQRSWGQDPTVWGVWAAFPSCLSQKHPGKPAESFQLWLRNKKILICKLLRSQTNDEFIKLWTWSWWSCIVY